MVATCTELHGTTHELNKILTKTRLQELDQIEKGPHGRYQLLNKKIIKIGWRDKLFVNLSRLYLMHIEDLYSFLIV